MKIAPPCPFQEGFKYRVRQNYLFLNHQFNIGEIVVFSTSAYSAKEGVMRYWFKSIESGDTNIWHVFDNQEQKIQWNDLFEEISN